jgi:hypothetical protein
MQHLGVCLAATYRVAHDFLTIDYGLQPVSRSRGEYTDGDGTLWRIVTTRQGGRGLRPDVVLLAPDFDAASRDVRELLDDLRATGVEVRSS